MTRLTDNITTPEGAVRPDAGRRRLFAGLAVGGLAGALFAGSMAAWSHHHGGPGGWHGGGRWCKAASSLEAHGNRMEFATDWVLNKVNATDMQRERVKTIMQGALEDLWPLRDRHRQHREAFMSAMLQPNVDRASLEALRRAELQLADSASNRIVSALADAAEVLTLQQRTELVKLAREFRH